MYIYSYAVLILYHFLPNGWALHVCMASGGLSQDFSGSGQNRVTAKNQVQEGSSHSVARNITVVKFN